MAGTAKGKNMGKLKTVCSAENLYKKQLDSQISFSPPTATQQSFSDHGRRQELCPLVMMSQRDVALATTSS